MNKSKIAQTFEQEEDEIPPCLEYYSGIDGTVVERVCHPDHLWTILDRLHSMVMDEESNEGITKNQQNFLQGFLSKWMDEIEPHCVRLEIE